MFEYIINFWSNFVKIILTLIFVISIFGFFFKKIYNHNHLRYFTFGLVASLIQLFLSLLLLFSKDFGLLNFKKQIIYFGSVFLIFLGWKYHNNSGDSRKKFLRIIIFYGLGLLVCLIN